MVIRTYEHGYSVVSRPEYGDGWSIYLCRGIGDGREYSMLSRKNDADCAGIAEYLAGVIKSGTFTDLVEFFVSEDNFCVVMRHTDGMNLACKLRNENPVLTERLEIGRRILERLLLLETPAYFLRCCMRSDRIMVSSVLDVTFDYFLTDLAEARGVSSEEVRASLCGVFRELFEGELRSEALPQLSDFMEELKTFETEDLMTLYRKYLAVSDAIRQLPPEEQKRNNTWAFRLWEGVKLHLKTMERILMVLLLAAALVYFVYTIRKSNATPSPGGTFSQIGTVSIPQGK